MPAEGTVESPATELETSVESVASTAADSTAHSDAKTSADSSVADSGEKSPKSLFDAIKAADTATKTSEVSPASTEAKKGDEQDPAKVGDAKDPAKKPDQAAKPNKDEDFSDVPFHQHPRFQKLAKERKEAIERNETFEREVQTLKPEVEDYRALTGFLRNQQVSFEDAVGAIRLQSMLQADPVKARESIAAILAQLDKVTGHELPEDLKAEVESGAISESKAQELARTRADRDLANRRASQVTQDAQQRTRTENLQVLKGTISKAATDWETAVAAKDPDFAKKRDLVAKEAKLIVFDRGKGLASVEDAQTVLTEALKRVNATVSGFVPKPRAIKEPELEGSGGTKVTPKPKSMFEAVRFAAGNSAAA